MSQQNHFPTYHSYSVHIPPLPGGNLRKKYERLAKGRAAASAAADDAPDDAPDGAPPDDAANNASDLGNFNISCTPKWMYVMKLRFNPVVSFIC
jgi:hypothetical protein